jgi:hypothetical protein
VSGLGELLLKSIEYKSLNIPEAFLFHNQLIDIEKVGYQFIPE